METPHTTPAILSTPPGKVLPRYQALALACRDLLVARFAKLFEDMLGEVDDFILGLADHAQTNQQRSHYFEIMHETLLHQAELQRVFAAELARGFDNFHAGRAEPLRTPVSPLDKTLSLIDQKDYEISLAYTEVARKANTRYAEHLLALNHRLAVLIGGAKLGEHNPALPGCPAQVCDAMHGAVAILPIEIDHRFHVAWVREFERLVAQRAGDIYAEINQFLANEGILPHLSLEAIGFQAGRAQGSPLVGSLGGGTQRPAAAPGVREDPSDTATPEHELFQTIRQMLARRHAGHTAAPAATNHAALIQALGSLPFNILPADQARFDDLPLEAVKANFAAQTAAVAGLIQRQPVAQADADLIELVGMLFEFVLNDLSLPDSVKALLCHLHTPTLKVAMLDRQFFSKAQHPARRLLNALAQAGARCNGSADDNLGIFAKLRSVVETVLHDFEDDPRVFQDILDDFTAFMDGLEQRSHSVEKRSVESAKGRERLREARQKVSKELVDLTWDRPLSRPVESLLLGSWANLLVLTYLRHGKHSTAWGDGLKTATDIVWSVQPKTTPAERQKLRALWPQLEDRILAGLALIGDPDTHAKAFFAELQALHGEIPGMAPETRPDLSDAAPQEDIELEVHPAPPEVQAGQAVWEDIDTPVPETADTPPEWRKAIEDLQAAKLGAWFEFSLPDKPAKLRAKLSWFSEQTCYYTFVDQVGIQVAVKSQRALCEEIAAHKTRILPTTKKPFVDRALEAVHVLLGPAEQRLEAPSGDFLKLPK